MQCLDEDLNRLRQPNVLLFVRRLLSFIHRIGALSMREYGLATTFLLAVILLVVACESSRAEAQEFGRRQFDWSWLGENSGTFWYVPEKYLPAIQWSTDDPGGYTVISDQTRKAEA